MDCPPLNVLCNHIYIFNVDDSKTSYSRQTYQDEKAIVKDLIPTRRSKRESRNLTAEKRSENIKSMYKNLNITPPPDIPLIK